MTDSNYTLGLVILFAVLTILYGVRILVRGVPRYERVEQMGGSALLSKKLAVMAYWALQPLGRGCIALGVTANRITWASVAFGLFSGIALAYGRFGLGAFFALLSNASDALDGLVARLTATASDAGEVLDAAADRYNEVFFFGGLLVFYRESPVLQLLTLSALCGSFMVSYSTAKSEALQVEVPRGTMRRPERSLYLILGAALMPLSSSWLGHSTTHLLWALLSPMALALGLIALAANGSALRRFVWMTRALRGRVPVTMMDQVPLEDDESLALEDTQEPSLGPPTGEHVSSMELL